MGRFGPVGVGKRMEDESVSKKALAYSLAFTLTAFPFVHTTQAVAAPLSSSILSSLTAEAHAPVQYRMTLGLTRTTCASREVKLSLIGILPKWLFDT
ncbi:hypothetical protein ACINKY_17920 [Paenibacillus illinoisensis]|uniref:Uncharacterized protein n=1 Tax=Paenibacillus illinoisensis TaxID=59845 RepID=A0ABW8HYU4_9BACL